MAELVKVSELSKQLKVSPSHIRREIEKGNLQALNVGATVRISTDEVERYIASLPAYQKKEKVKI
jgi:excisionase family DNA binding protein